MGKELFTDEEQADKDLVDHLKEMWSRLDPQIDDLAGLVERASAEMHTFRLETIGPDDRHKADVDRVMALAVALRDLHDIFEAAKKAVNRASTKVEEYGCKIILEEDELNWKCEEGTFSPRPSGFFSVNDGEEFLKYLDSDIPTFCRLVKSSKELGTFCEELLENGEPLPPCISKHLEAKLTIRRKR